MPNPTKPDKQDNNRNGDGTFKKGESGNPNGRPKKGLAISDILESIGARSHSVDKSMKEKVLEVVYESALAGDLNCAKFIADRTEGTALQKMSVTTNEPVQVLKIVDQDETV